MTRKMRVFLISVDEIKMLDMPHVKSIGSAEEAAEFVRALKATLAQQEQEESDREWLERNKHVPMDTRKNVPF